MKLILFSTLLITACGQIKTKSDVYVHQEPLKVEINAKVVATIAIQADPAITTLIKNKCNTDQVCSNKEMGTLVESFSNTLTNLGIVK